MALPLSACHQKLAFVKVSFPSCLGLVATWQVGTAVYGTSLFGTVTELIAYCLSLGTVGKGNLSGSSQKPHLKAILFEWAPVSPRRLGKHIGNQSDMLVKQRFQH